MKPLKGGSWWVLLYLWSGWLRGAEEPATSPQKPTRVGFITQMKGTKVAVSLGREDGAAVGMALAVMRDGKRVGTVRLIQVGKVQSKGTIEPHPEGFQLLYVGDRVEIALSPGQEKPPREIVPSPQEEGKLPKEEGEPLQGEGPSPPEERPPSPPGPRKSSLPTGLSLEGYSGLIRTPVAAVLSDGEAMGLLAYRLPSLTDPHLKAQGDWDVKAAVGFLPDLELTLRFQTGNAGQSANLQYQIARETAKRPAIVVGSQDLGGTQELESDYLALSRSQDGIRATLGVGRGQLSGFFGGLEVQIGRDAALLADYDTETVNLGLRYQSPQGLAIDVAWLDHHRLVPVLAYRTFLDHSRGKSPGVQLSRVPLDETVSPAWAGKVAQALAQRGFENVRVGFTEVGAPSELTVEYENRIYNHNELDGLGVVLAEAVRHSPSRVSWVKVILKEANLPVLQMRVPIEDYLQFLAGEMEAATFACKLEISEALPGRSGGTSMSPLLQKSVGRLELLARPGFAFRVQENGSLFKNSLRGEALTQWRKGGMAFLQVDWPYSNSLDQDDQLKILRGGIQQTWRWPQHGMTQLGIGYFRPRQYGLFSETMLPMKNDLAIFRLTQLGPEWSHWSQTRAVAEYRYRLPRLDLSVALSAGQFVDGDRGWILELGRYFGDVRIAPFVRDTSNGRLGGVWLSLPLSGQQNRSFQGPVRFRWGDWFDFKVDTNMERPNYFLDDVGNWIFTGRSVDRMFLNNDRLYPAYLREHVDRLKAAVAPWSQTN